MRDLTRTAAADLAGYPLMRRQLLALIDGERDGVANMANFSALVYHGLSQLNWAGFYLLRDGELVLGPFQGKPACVRIAVGRGVCGAAVQRRAAIVVPDVETFPGHIACDGASRSELVVPLWRDSEVIGVFDLDSPVTARFNDSDRAGIENLLAVLMNHEQR